MNIRSIFPLILSVTTIALSACVYSSQPPTPDSSGNTGQSTDDTDPSSSDTDAGASSGSGSGTGTGSGSGSGGGSGTSKDAGSGGSTGVDSGSGSGGEVDSGSGAGTGAPTFSVIYTSYFAASSVGECARSGCHSGSKGGFACGSSASTCYTGLVNAGLINTASPTSSKLISTSNSPLEWFGGDMPKSGGSNAQAVTDITAWVNAGALDN